MESPMYFLSAATRKTFIFAAFFIAFLPGEKSSFADSWSPSPSSELPQKEITKFCKNDGSVVYSNFERTDAEACGSVQTAVLCDPAGNKFMGPAQAPHGYIDCSVGPRIQVISTIRGDDPKYTGAWLEKPKVEHVERVSNRRTEEPQHGRLRDYFHDLDGLLGDESGGGKQASSKSAGKFSGKRGSENEEGLMPDADSLKGLIGTLKDLQNDL